MRKFWIFILVLSFGSLGFAADRVSLVQSKIDNTLTGILSKSDYIVIVNRVDQLDDFSSSSSSGAIRTLPGLTVGVDEKGQVVKQDNDNLAYNGDVSISIILDKAVKEETYKTIEKMLPEIAGGLHDGDEVKISRSQLRQLIKPAESPVTVNNITQPNNTAYSDSLKFIALLMIGSGLFAWLLGKFLPQSKSDNSVTSKPPSSDKSEDHSTAHAKILESLDLTELSPEATSLYLLKCLKDNNPAPFTSWFELSPVSYQRKVFMELPAWAASYMQALIRKSPFAEEPVPADMIYREISILEQSLKCADDKERYFLLWFPAQSLRHVPKNIQKNVSSETRLALWFLRPELGDFVRVNSMNANDISKEPTKKQFSQAYLEMKTWASTAYAHDVSGERDIIDSWASMINSLSEFSPIQSQLQQAKEKLSSEQLAQLLTKVVSAETPLSFTSQELKHWLLLIDPNDYQWWLSVSKAKPEWNLASLLRPMRHAMFQIAETDQIFLSWPENEKKEAAKRILFHLRQVHLGESVHEALAS